jgi:5-methyltetrahydropteroyltriglutamate--homocysteine methyltransferase
LATYFECSGDNLATTLSLPVDCLHVDLVRCPSQLGDILNHEAFVNGTTKLSLGLVDGRNIWKNDFTNSLSFIEKAFQNLAKTVFGLHHRVHCYIRLMIWIWKKTKVY